MFLIFAFSTLIYKFCFYPFFSSDIESTDYCRIITELTLPIAKLVNWLIQFCLKWSV